MRRRISTGALLCSGVALAALGGCTVGPSWTRPMAWSPTHWFGHAAPRQAPTPAESLPVAERIDPHWWNLLHDAELSSLETRVAGANLNVRLATIRLAESRSQRQITGADQFPTLQGDGSYTRERLSQKGAISLIGGGASAGGTSFGSMGSSANGMSGRTGAIPSTVTQGKTASMRRGSWTSGAASGARSKVPMPASKPAAMPAATACSACWPRSRATTSSYAASRRSSPSPTVISTPRSRASN
jgi:hypothetical protein